jgi:hypothetical protein
MDDYLKQLADAMIENNRKTQEENAGSLEDINTKMDYLPSIGGQRFPLTKQLLARNPNIPQDDIQDYAQNVKDDAEGNMMAIGGMSGGIKMLKPVAQAGMKLLPKIAPKVAEALENAPRYAKDLAEEYLPKSISSKVDDLYYGAKAKDNIVKFNTADAYNAKLQALEDLAMAKPRTNIPFPKDQKPIDLDVFQRNFDIDKAIEAQSNRFAAENSALYKDPEKLKEALEKTITTTSNKK